jgi:hypothetical protein
MNINWVYDIGTQKNHFTTQKTGISTQRFFHIKTMKWKKKCYWHTKTKYCQKAATLAHKKKVVLAHKKLNKKLLSFAFLYNQIKEKNKHFF